MGKHVHEIRDPIHVFVRLDSDERAVLDSRPFQRLRHIHQLAMTSLLYPAATHKRFEHSLGVMELAGRVYDVVTNPENVTDTIRKMLPEIEQKNQREYWRRVTRMAALCHDVGHLPFSHAAEKELLPDGWDHERLTREIVRGPEMSTIWGRMTPPLRAEDIEKLCIGPRKAKELIFTRWESILAEIIVGDSFGVDRMDYLLRDSYHTGVPYGRFDHIRLIDTLRILPSAEAGEPELSLEPGKPALGVEEGGLHSAEALLLGRYYMYSQVYFHPIRRIYDIHLKDFLSDWLPGGQFPTDIELHLKRTDNDVTAGILVAAFDSSLPGHEPARRIARHKHYKVLYKRHPSDILVNPQAGAAIYSAACQRFGAEAVRRDHYLEKRDTTRFPVSGNDGRISAAEDLSAVIRHLPLVEVDFTFIHPDLYSDAVAWLKSERDTVIRVEKEG